MKRRNWSNGDFKKSSKCTEGKGTEEDAIRDGFHKATLYIKKN